MNDEIPQHKQGLFQVLHLKDGEEYFSEPEPYDFADITAKALHDQGYEVSSVMTQASAEAYRAYRRQWGVPGSSPVKEKPQDHLRIQTRHLAVELALEMHHGHPDIRTADEVIGDAETILAFLNG